MAIIITAFERSPDGGRGLARDTRIRWALEELGLPYEVRLVPWEALKAPENLARQPFGQIPSYEEDGLVLFETGPSCCIWQNGIRACCPRSRRRGQGRFPGFSRR